MSDELLSRITSDPEVCGGKPIIRGLRVRVADILDMLASGMTTADIIREYPYLEADDVPAALAFAARAVDHPIAISKAS